MDSLTHPIADLFGNDLSRDEFCRRVGVSKSHLSLILQGKRGISYKLATAIEAEFKLPAADLMKHQKALTEEIGAAA